MCGGVRDYQYRENLQGNDLTLKTTENPAPPRLRGRSGTTSRGLRAAAPYEAPAAHTPAHTRPACTRDAHHDHDDRIMHITDSSPTTRRRGQRPRNT